MTHAERSEQAERPRTNYKPRHAAPPLRASTLQKNPRILAQWSTPPAGAGAPHQAKKRPITSWLRGSRGDQPAPHVEIPIG